MAITKITEHLSINGAGKSVVLDGFDFTSNGYVRVTNAAELVIRNCRVYGLNVEGAKKNYWLYADSSAPLKLTVERCFFGANPGTLGASSNLTTRNLLGGAIAPPLPAHFNFENNSKMAFASKDYGKSALYKASFIYITFYMRRRNPLWLYFKSSVARQQNCLAKRLKMATPTSRQTTAHFRSMLKSMARRSVFASIRPPRIQRRVLLR